MKNLKSFGLIASFIFLLLIIYFDLIARQKPENWSIVRSVLGVILAIMGLIYAYNKSDKLR